MSLFRNILSNERKYVCSKLNSSPCPYYYLFVVNPGFLLLQTGRFQKLNDGTILYYYTILKKIE